MPRSHVRPTSRRVYLSILLLELFCYFTFITGLAAALINSFLLHKCQVEVGRVTFFRLLLRPCSEITTPATILGTTFYEILA